MNMKSIYWDLLAICLSLLLNVVSFGFGISSFGVLLLFAVIGKKVFVCDLFTFAFEVAWLVFVFLFLYFLALLNE